MRPRRALLLLALPLAACRGTAASTDAGPVPIAAPAPASAPASGAVPASASAPAPAACPPRPACDAPLPALSPRPFKHKRSRLAAAAGAPRHRGRDLFLRPGGPQWVIAKFAYGPQDKDLEDEEIDVYLLRGCGAAWEKIGTRRTTDDDRPHPPVLGVTDSGGRVFLDIAKETRPLDIGRHRVHMAVAGDGTAADLFLEVLPPGARVAVTDVDGTLTSSEAALLDDLAGGEPPAAHPGAADAMRALAGRGYFVFYLTARPEWLVDKTRQWLSLRGFPPGLLRTTLSSAGAIGASAAAFKATELALLKGATGIVPELAFGNMPSDVDTYWAAGIHAARRYFYKLDGDLRGGVRHDDYTALAPSLAALPAACP
ncbi:MAG: phosphatidylinositol transfer protein [Polyangiaceae bacterium]|nr:phosphatidylinositol transfer protein [Polyangiaceae bacterium]